MKPHRENMDIVDRAAAALAGQTVPPGPPAEKLQVVLDAASAAAIRPSKGKRIMRHMPKIAAAVLILAAVGATITWLTVGYGGATVAWADVQQQLLSVRTMTCRLSIAQPGMPAMEMKMYFKEPGLMRQEVTAPAQAITVFDMSQQRAIALTPVAKRAIVMDLSNMPEEMKQQQEEQNFLDQMKKAVRESESPLGERIIDGRRCLGFEVTMEGLEFEVWADAQTGEPLEVTAAFFAGEAQMTMYDFTFDEALDDSLFSLEIPEEYQVISQTLDLKPAGAEDILWLLEFLSEARGGTLPDALTPGAFVRDVQSANSRMSLKGQTEEEQMAEGMKMGERFARVAIFLQMHPEAVYAGKGVSLGDAETPILWYRPEKDADSWTIICGDLTVVEDVAEQNLPDEPVESEDKPADQAAESNGQEDAVFASSDIRVQMNGATGNIQTCGSTVPATVEVLGGQDDERATFAFSNGSRIPVVLPARVYIIRNNDKYVLDEFEITEPGAVIEVSDALEVTLDQ